MPARNKGGLLASLWNWFLALFEKKKYAHRKFHEKEGFPVLKKVHLVLLHIDETKQGELLQTKKLLKEALVRAGIPITITLLAEKIERTFSNNEHDIRFRVKIALLHDELTNILCAKGIEIKGIPRLTDQAIHALLRGNITSHEESAQMALASLISLEGVI